MSWKALLGLILNKLTSLVSSKVKVKPLIAGNTVSKKLV